jgi:hypothetical protein
MLLSNLIFGHLLKLPEMLSLSIDGMLKFVAPVVVVVAAAVVVAVDVCMADPPPAPC